MKMTVYTTYHPPYHHYPPQALCQICCQNQIQHNLKSTLTVICYEYDFVPHPGHQELYPTQDNYHTEYKTYCPREGVKNIKIGGGVPQIHSCGPQNPDPPKNS